MKTSLSGADKRMHQKASSLEILRWGFIHMPGAVFFYAKELDLDMEDIGILAAMFYSFENTKPLFQTGVRAGQVLQGCSNLTTNKLSRKLQKLAKNEIIDIVDGHGKSFSDKIIRLEPLMNKLEELVLRDHPRILPLADQTQPQQTVRPVDEYLARIEQLELELEEERQKPGWGKAVPHDPNYKKVADFIAKKTGSLLSVKMESELRKWLADYGFTPEFLLCMLEMAIERSITNPRDITRIAGDLKEYSINSVEGLNVYFRNYVDSGAKTSSRSSHFDPDIAEFGTFTGVDMSAEARQRVYRKWRYDWGFSHPMIMKAGELMCQRTKNGGLEYVDSVLNNWMSKEIRNLADVDKELLAFKKRSKSTARTGGGNVQPKRGESEYDFYVPPEILAELKSKV